MARFISEHCSSFQQSTSIILVELAIYWCIVALFSCLLSSVWWTTLSRLKFLLVHIRAYLLHYDHKYGEAVLNQEWSQHLTLTTKEIDPFGDEWYMSHRSTWGNVRHISLLFLPLCFVIAVALMGGLIWKGTSSFFETELWVRNGCWIIWIGLIGIVWTKFPRTHDQLHVRGMGAKGEQTAVLNFKSNSRLWRFLNTRV